MVYSQQAIPTINQNKLKKFPSSSYADNWSKGRGGEGGWGNNSTWHEWEMTLKRTFTNSRSRMNRHRCPLKTPGRVDDADLKTTLKQRPTFLRPHSGTTVKAWWGWTETCRARWWRVGTHTGLCQRKLFFYFLRTWRWFWLEYYARTKKSGDGRRDLFAKDGMHATFICLHADEKERKTTSELASFNNAHKAYLKQLSPPLRKYLHLDW